MFDTTQSKTLLLDMLSTLSPEKKLALILQIFDLRFLVDLHEPLPHSLRLAIL